MTAPVKRAAEVLFRDYENEHGSGTAADFEPLALAVIVAALEGTWIEEVLIEHTRVHGIKGDCACGTAGRLGRHFEEHPAAAVFSYATGGTL